MVAGISIGPPLALGQLVASYMNTVDTLQTAMTFHRERHTVLAGNVANLDTPGYRPVDLIRGDGTAGSLAATSSGVSITSAANGAGDVIQSFDDGGTLQSQDGNAVSLERELSKIDANRTRYATSAELVGRRLALLRYAAGDGT